MSRIRFELLLANIHFSDNERAANGNRLSKIQPLQNLLILKFQKTFVPNKNVCIGETMIPFRGRLSFRQYIPGKRHKYGVKPFKCVRGKRLHPQSKNVFWKGTHSY
jgi:hypothetical protein